MPLISGLLLRPVSHFSLFTMDKESGQRNCHFLVEHIDHDSPVEWVLDLIFEAICWTTAKKKIAGTRPRPVVHGSIIIYVCLYNGPGLRRDFTKIATTPNWVHISCCLGNCSLNEKGEENNKIWTIHWYLFWKLECNTTLTTGIRGIH